MGSDDEFGPDTETIRAWLAKRATYAGDARVIGAPRGATTLTTRPDATTAAPPSPSPTPPTPIDERDIGRSILDALDTAPTSTDDGTTRTREPAPATTRLDGSRWQAPEQPDAGRGGTDIDFPARTGIRRIMALILLLCVAATGGATYVAGTERTPATIGVAGILGFLTLVVWAVHASGTTTRLSIRRGKLHVQRGGATEVVDIGNRYTPLAMVGEPGDRRWTVLVERPGQPLLVITRGMVDPALFTEVLYRLRPELRRLRDAS